MLATASADHYARAMRLLLQDSNVDSLITIFIPPLVTAAADVARAMSEAAASATKPVLATFMGVEGAIPGSRRFPAIASRKPPSRRWLGPVATPNGGTARPGS